jgi:glycosyltransferase involved in cell wall biosynthesis
VRIAEINDVAFVASELSAGLRARGHDVTLIHPRLVGAGLPAAIKPGVAPIRLLNWIDIARQVRQGNFDAVHIHYAYLGVIGAIGRFPYVLHCHGDDVRDLAQPVRRPIIELALKRAAHVYYATPDLWAQIEPLRPDAEFLPNPIDTELFRPVPLEPNGPDAFIACSLNANKGVENILEACQRLIIARPGIRITALAGGEQTKVFDDMAQVTLVAYQPRPKLPALVGRHRVIIGQAHNGAIGMTELEAMACGRPVVSHFVYDDAYDEPPPLMRAHSGEEITTAVLELLDDEAGARERGCASRAWIERNHDVREIAERVESELLRLAAR